MGLLDQPTVQRQDPWRLDLGRAGGHVAVIGAPQSGRTTFLQTLAAAAALTHTPRQLNLYALDLSGGPLPRIAGFPHVGGVATRAQPDRMRRLVEELLGMLAVRERVFADHGLDSLAMLRAEHAAGRIPELVSADVVLLLDGYGALRTDFEELESPVVELLQRGGGFGMHVVLAMTRWNELRMAQQSLVGTRVELRLNDPIDSVVGRRLAETIRPDQPGRALTDDGLFVQVAQPVGGSARGGSGSRVAGHPGPGRLARSGRAADPGAADRPRPGVPASGSWSSRPRCRSACVRTRWSVALLELGIRDQHLVAFGDSGIGQDHPAPWRRPGPGRGVRPGRGGDRRAGPARERWPPRCRRRTWAGTRVRRPRPVGLCATIAAELERRSTGGAAAREGEPRIVLLVDDYDMLATADPLRPLLPYLPSARDLGLHVILARPVAGAARAAYDMVLQTLRDTGGTTSDDVRRTQRGSDHPLGVRRTAATGPRPGDPPR